MDVFSCETGVSRFLELKRNHDWIYNKTENLSSFEKRVFTHLLIEAECERDDRLAPFKQTHSILGFVNAYSGLHFSPTSFKFVKIPQILQKPKIFILKKLH